MSFFEDTFGQEFGTDVPGSEWDKPYFNNQGLTSKDVFVAWIDLMGASNQFLSSISTAAVFIGKIHDAGLKAQSKYPSISLHPITDGFYAIGDDWENVRDFTARVLRSMAYLFETETYPDYRVIVRSAIASGKIIDGTLMAKGSATFNGQDSYVRNALVGSPLAWAYKAESKAPPFGIYIDQSVTSQSDAKVSWVLQRWWEKKSDAHQAWAKYFGGKVKDHFEWLKQNSIEKRYPIAKHDEYIRAITEYFSLDQK